MSKLAHKNKIAFLGFFLFLFICVGSVLASNSSDPEALFTTDVKTPSLSTNIHNFFSALKRRVFGVSNNVIPVDSPEVEVASIPNPIISPTALASSPTITVVTNIPNKVSSKKINQVAKDSNLSDSTILAIIKRLLGQKEYQDLLRGPKGDSIQSTAMTTSQLVKNTTPIYSPAPIPSVFMPVGISQPNPVANFSGASFFNATDLSSRYFKTSEATIGSLSITGSSSLTGDLNIVGNINFSGTLMPGGLVGTAGQVLTSAGPGIAPTWETPSLFGLTDGSGTTANGTAVDLGGTMTSSALINTGGASFEVSSGTVGLLLYPGIHGTYYHSTVLGDFNVNGNGTLLRILDDASSVYFTDTNGDVKFGINNSAPTAALDVYGSANINSANGLIQLGDINNNSSQTNLTIDDVTPLAKLQSGSLGINIDHLAVSVGDIVGNGNGTKLVLDDSNNLSYFPSGNVGIGTTTPNSKLYIKDDTNFTSNNLTIENDYSIGGGAGLNIISSLNGVTQGTANIQVTGSNDLSIGSSNDLILNDTSGNRIRIGTGGGGGSVQTIFYQGNLSVGGVDTPGSRLVVKGSGTTSSTSSLNITDSSNNSRFFVRDDGNVGIGDASPNALLTVGNGDLFQIDSSGFAHAPTGSIVGPSYSFTGDTASGMYSPSSGQLGFVASGHGMILSSPSGNPVITVGAGTESEQFIFNYGTTGGGDFTGSMSSTQQMSFGFNNGANYAGSANATSGRTIYFYDRISAAYMGGFSSSGLTLGPSSTNYSFLAERPNASITAMIIKATGNIGVGITNPSFPLSFNGSSTGNRIGLFDEGSGTGYGLGIGTGVMQIFADGASTRVGIGYGNSTSFTETLTVKGANVGIGTTSPGAKLEVGGDIYLSTGADRTIKVAAPGGGVAGNSLYLAAASAVSAAAGGSVYVTSGTGAGGPANGIISLSSDTVGIGRSYTPSASYVLDVDGRTLPVRLYKSFNTGMTVNLSAANTITSELYLTQQANNVALFGNAGGSTGGGAGTYPATSAGIMTNSGVPLVLGAGGAEQMRILSGGNVGIGTSSPGYKLELSGGQSNFTASTYYSAVDTGWTANFATSAAGGGNYGIRLGADSGAGIIQTVQNAAPIALKIQPFGANILIGTTGSKVGIGNIASPNATLQIESSAADTASFAVQSNGALSQAFVIGYTEGGSTTGFLGTTYNSNSARFDIRMKGIASSNAVMTFLGSGNVGIGTTSPVGKLQLGDLTSNGSNSYMIIGHNGTTSSSSDGTSTIRFASQFSNYPYTLGAEGNGYNFYLRQNNTNQGAINMDFSGTGTLVFQKTTTSSTQPIDITTDKNFNLYTSGADKYLTIFSSTSSLNGSAAPDNVYLARPIVGSGYERTSEPVVTIRNGLPSVASDNVVGNKAYWYRNGYIGIGTTNTDANTTNPLKAALTINQGTLTGYANNTHATASNVKTVGSSTTVSFTPDNGNSNVTYGIIVGSKITANSITRTVTSVSQGQVVVDSAVDWSNGGSGYPFTYRNPYVNISDSTNGIFGIDPSGNVGIGTTTPATILNVVSSSTNPILRIESNAAGSVAVTPTLDFTSSNGLFNTTVSRIEASTGSGIPLLNFYVHNGTTLKNRFTINNNGDLTQVGDGARSSQGIYFNSVNPSGSKFIKVSEQSATSQTGEGLTLEAGTANASSTDKSGGDITIVAGGARGTGSSNIFFKTAAAGSSGTGANASTERLKITGAGTAVFTPTVTTGTGATAGVQILANSLTSGNGLDVSSSSLTSGNLVSFSSNTSSLAASNTQTILNVSTSGANPINQTTYGGYFSNTHTGTNSFNIGLFSTASGGANNYAAKFDGTVLIVGSTTACLSFGLGSCASSDVYVQKNGTLLTMQGSGQTTIAVGGTSYLDAVGSKVRLFAGGSGEVLIGTSTDAGAFSLQSIGNTYINPNVYANAVGGLTLARSVNFTGVAAETALDLSVKPSLTLTEPGSGTFTWNGGDIDMSSIAVTAGAGTTAINAFRLAGVSDADVGTSRGLFVANLTGTAATEEAIHTGTGWDYAAIFEAGNVGIQNTAPGYALHVGSSATTDATTLIRLEDANSTCDFNANAGGPTCGSDLTLKKDIASLDTVDLLTRVSALNPVEYHWLTQDSLESLQYGFIAQEVEAQFPDLVTEHTWIDGTTKKFLNMGGLMPYVVGAVKELDIKVTGIENIDDAVPFTNNLRAWLANATNRITRIFTGEVCLTDADGTSECLNKNELHQLKQLLNAQAPQSVETPPPADNPPPVEPPPADNPPTDNPPTP